MKLLKLRDSLEEVLTRQKKLNNYLKVFRFFQIFCHSGGRVIGKPQMKQTQIKINEEVGETSEKHRTILTQTEQIETVMTLIEVEPNLPQFQQGYPPVPQEVTLLQSGTLMVLWFFVLLSQVLLFWQSKNRG